MTGNLTQGYDFQWTISNHDDGKASVSWTGNGKTMYIGELKAHFQHMIKGLDRAAESWGVPNDLDAYGRARGK